MIGDPARTITTNFNVLMEEEGASCSVEVTFIHPIQTALSQSMEINADGIGRDASILVNKIKAAQYVRNNPGEVCLQLNGKRFCNT